MSNSRNQSFSKIAPLTNDDVKVTGPMTEDDSSERRHSRSDSFRLFGLAPTRGVDVAVPPESLGLSIAIDGTPRVNWCFHPDESPASTTRTVSDCSG
jgi:hypothetical protein